MNNNINSDLNKIKKPHTRMMDEFKKAANPFYTENFGISLNNINFWQKNVAMQFIVVWAGGSSFTFVGLDARSILFNLGDTDNQKFNELSDDQAKALQEYFTNSAPKQE